jgi:hypothetical protein
MSRDSFRAKAYLKVGCPFSFKFLLFASEAGLLDRFEIVRCDPEQPEFEQIKAKLERATGAKASFPTVEIEPGKYKSDSDALIDSYSRQHDARRDKLVALRFYEESIFPQLLELHEQGKH